MDHRHLALLLALLCGMLVRFLHLLSLHSPQDKTILILSTDSALDI